MARLADSLALPAGKAGDWRVESYNPQHSVSNYDIILLLFFFINYKSAWRPGRGCPIIQSSHNLDNDRLIGR